MAPPMERIIPSSGPGHGLHLLGQHLAHRAADPLGDRVDQVLPDRNGGLDPLRTAPGDRGGRAGGQGGHAVEPQVGQAHRLLDLGTVLRADTDVFADGRRRPRPAAARRACGPGPRSAGRCPWPCPSSPGRPRRRASGPAAGRPPPGRSGRTSRRARRRASRTSRPAGCRHHRRRRRTRKDRALRTGPPRCRTRPASSSPRPRPRAPPEVRRIRMGCHSRVSSALCRRADQVRCVSRPLPQA